MFVAGRTRSKFDNVAREISAAGGTVETAEVDALGEDVPDACRRVGLSGAAASH